MRTQCERPGCGAVVEAHYGIDAGNLLVWIDNRALDQREHAGSLCRRHADALTVPRGWSIEDRRDVRPVLFRVPEQTAAPAAASARQTRRRPAQHIATAPSLFDAEDAPSDPVPVEVASASTEPPAIGDAETVAMPWSPRLSGRADEIFDGSDGMPRPVLGRLLGRAFRSEDEAVEDAHEEAG